MTARLPILCSIVGAFIGALLIAAPSEKPLPLPIAYVIMPAVPLLYGTTSSWAVVVAANAAIYGFLGLFVGLAIAFRQRNAHRARRPNGGL